MQKNNPHRAAFDGGYCDDAEKGETNSTVGHEVDYHYNLAGK